jgi:methylated-DNA-[protein]-cysteine S-methyltransferase
MSIHHAFRYWPSPLGPMLLAASPEGLTRVHWLSADECATGLPPAPEQIPASIAAILQLAETELVQYFAGSLQQFTVPLDLVGTPFQRTVWQQLQTIPYAQTISYKQLALQAGNAKASRAVGMANNRNPVALIVPCHRVIGADGKLVGYAGGLALKQGLLELERCYAGVMSPKP